MQHLNTSVTTPEKYVGTYVVGDKKGLTIRLYKNQLYFQKHGESRRYNLYATGDQIFSLFEKPDNISFEFEEKDGQMLLKVYENAGAVTLLNKK